MSLGSPFGTKDDRARSPRRTRPRRASSSSPRPATAARARTSPARPAPPRARSRALRSISTPEFPGVTITTPAGSALPAVNANEHPYTRSDRGPADQDDLRTTRRHGAGRVARLRRSPSIGTRRRRTRSSSSTAAPAPVSQGDLRPEAGAAAVVMVNNADPLPAVRGQDHRATRTRASRTPSPSRSSARGTSATSDGGKLARRRQHGRADAAAPIANPGYTGYADFRRGGPRTGDSGLKPDVAAPGVASSRPAWAPATAPRRSPAPRWPRRTSPASPRSTRQAHPTLARRGHQGGDRQHRRSGADSQYPSASAGRASCSRCRVDGHRLVVAPRTCASGDPDARNYGFAELNRDFMTDQDASRVQNFGSSPATSRHRRSDQGGSPHSRVVSAAAGWRPASAAPST